MQRKPIFLIGLIILIAAIVIWTSQKKEPVDLSKQGTQKTDHLKKDKVTVLQKTPAQNAEKQRTQKTVTLMPSPKKELHKPEGTEKKWVTTLKKIPDPKNIQKQLPDKEDGFLEDPREQLDDRSKEAFNRIDRAIRNWLGMPLRGTPDLKNLKGRLAKKGVSLGAPIFIRIFKKEYQLELWVKKGSRFMLFDTYPICMWSGKLGPKLKQGDRQAPEGFYTVGKGQLNPNSKYHRSFNLGYPNVFDRSYGRTGKYLMVHGSCVSIGCYAMTDAVITELWRFITAALNTSQRRFHVHVFPFRMTEWNLAAHKKSKWFPFWKELKRGHDIFEASRIPPRVSVCNKRYHVKPAKNVYNSGIQKCT